MTDEYIRREDALKGKKTGTFANGICLVAEPCVTVEYIESLEPADVVPVVRCRDCRYLHKDFSNGIYPNKKWCSRITEYIKPDDFCSYGERWNEHER